MYPVMGVLLISATAIADVKVTQSPEVIEVTEGGEFQIFCTFIASNRTPVFAFHWYKEALGREKSLDTKTSDGPVGQRLQKHGQPLSNSQITTVDANQNDSGIYYCEVDLMKIGKGIGMGTRVTVNAAAIADIKVIQRPKIIEVTEGGEFQISCTFTASNMTSVFAFHWYKQALGREKSCVTNTSEEFVGRVLQKHGKPSNGGQITVMEANQNDSGIYYCEVKLIQIGKGTGMGTLVTVNGQAESKEEASKHKLITLSSALVVTTLLLLLIAILIFLSHNNCQNRTPTTRNDTQGDTSNNVIYADLHIAKPKTQRPGNLTNNNQRNEDNVVYAVVGPGRDKNNKNQAPVRPRKQMEEPVVYGVVKTPARQ